MSFESEITCSSPQERGLWFIFRNGELLCLEKGEEYIIPEMISLSEIGVAVASPFFLGRLDGKNCWAAGLGDEAADLSDCCPPFRTVFKNLRELYPFLGDELFALAGRALQLWNWHVSWKYCPGCGGKLNESGHERAKICGSCTRTYYPVISPAIIVAVTRGDRILLARNNRHRGFKRFSILAGFVEAGESLEETVKREVFEEVGIRVKNIKYYGSQSWPYPHSLMIGFTAEHESGEISVDGIEIGEADWFSVSGMPDIPPYGSISRVLIDNFIKKHS